MTVAPTPEQFLAQTEPDEDHEPEQTPLTPVAQMAPYAPSPLESIAASLRQIAGSYVQVELAETEDAALQTRVRDLEAEVTEIEALHDAKQALIDEVLAICKPSVGKLANSIRAALEPVVEPPAAEPVPAANAAEMGHLPPALDAPVEAWRAYAESLGYPEGTVIDQMNRSQIRTLLGLSHVEA